MFDGSGGRLSHQKRGLYLSAARSLLFNKVLSRRVTENNWNQPLEGERLILDGSRNSFLPDQIDITEIPTPSLGHGYSSVGSAFGGGAISRLRRSRTIGAGGAGVDG